MREIKLTLTTADPQTTCALAARISGYCKAGDCIMLRGDLGAGKTTFARGFIQARCDTKEDVVSPTFTLVQPYLTRDGHTIWHFDLYRLKSPAELQEIGLEDALASGISLIEWPELARNRLPKQALDIHISYLPHSDMRQLTLSGDNSIWQSCFKELEQEMAHL